VKILADVNLSQRVVANLRSAGVDAVRASEVMSPRAADEEIIAMASKMDAVLVSRDQDFSALLAVSGATRPSLVNVRVSFVDADRVAKSIVDALRAAADDLAKGAIVTIDDRGIRIHPLPIG
jgi:predicted nuclease of predicted toxin-antitoxin system